MKVVRTSTSLCLTCHERQISFFLITVLRRLAEIEYSNCDCSYGYLQFVPQRALDLLLYVVVLYASVTIRTPCATVCQIAILNSSHVYRYSSLLLNGHTTVVWEY